MPHGRLCNKLVSLGEQMTAQCFASEHSLTEVLADALAESSNREFFGSSKVRRFASKDPHLNFRSPSVRKLEPHQTNENKRDASELSNAEDAH